jgi:hypothetical protein
MHMAKRGRPSKLSSLSVADLQAELRRRQRGVTSLLKRRAALAARLSRLDDQLRDLGASGDGVRMPGRRGAIPGRKRPRNEMNLVEALARTLKGRTLGVTEAAEAVQKAGYKTGAANFRTIVNQALIKNKKVFKKVARGQYTAA